MKIVGMHCATCAITIERKLKSLRGVIDAQVSLASESADIVYDPGKVSMKEIVRAVRDVGYDVYKEEILLAVKDLKGVEDEKRIEDYLKKNPGVIDCMASHITQSIRITINPLQIDTEKIKELVESLGYTVLKVTGEVEVEDIERKVLAKQLKEMKKATLISLPLAVILALYIYTGYLNLATPPFWEYRNLVGFILSTPVVVLGGRRFFAGAWRALKNKTANMDTLVTLGTGSAYVYSLAVFLGLLDFEDTYFEAAAVVLAFILLGRYLELKMKFRTGEAIRKLLQLQAKTARVIRGDKEVEIPVDQVKLKDVVIVRAGERIPVDGIIIDGQDYVDESMLTGEPMPALKKERDPVVAGTLLKTGALKIIVTRVGKETVLSQIIKLVRYAQTAKPPIQKSIDKIAGVFTWIIIVIAIATFTFWYGFYGVPLSLAILFTASVLLVACPCALGLATPTVIMVGVGRAAEEGIIIKNAEALEKVGKLSTIVFDKTGTLTKGEPEVTDIVPLNGFATDKILQLAYIAERRSEHPLAEAIVKKAKKERLTPDIEPEFFDTIPGQGVIAKFNGSTVVLGNEKLMNSFEVDLSAAESYVGRLRAEAKTVIYMAVGGNPGPMTLAGLFAIADTPRPYAKEVISRLRRMGLEVVMLTGDNRKTAEAIARNLGIDRVIAEVLPEDKTEVIKNLQREGKIVAMVGDGINDAPSLSQADVGIAMGGGTDIAKEAGDIVLVKNDLRAVLSAIKVSKAILRKIKFNTFWAFIYNTLLIPVAAGALYTVIGLILRPEFAGLAMALSSISVTGNALLLKRWKPEI
ncbi:MAG: copper-translocating P-type ATPase [Thermoproteales archaeon]|nr:copper-translocating P-type ATPase [Thermoproteales archaeon]